MILMFTSLFSHKSCTEFYSILHNLQRKVNIENIPKQDIYHHTLLCIYLTIIRTIIIFPSGNKHKNDRLKNGN